MPDIPAFGAILQDRDERDYDLSKAASAVPVPESFRPDYSKVEVRHQHKQPACGAHAGSTLEGILSLAKGERGVNNSPRFLWKNIKDADGYPISSGTDMYSIFRQLKGVGVCDVSLAPNDDEADKLSLEDYRNLPVTPAMSSDAAARKIDSYAFIYSPTFQQIKDAIYKFGAVIIQYQCGANMYMPSWNEKDILPLSPDKFPMDSGHFTVGIDYDEKYVYFRNSWGDTWGAKGDGYFGEDYVRWVYAIGTAIDKEQVTPAVLPKYAFDNDLTIGSTGADVAALQKLLEAQGLLKMPQGVAYGYFGPITQEAVAAYQKLHNIIPSIGYFGPKTRSAMNG